ncbi:MAG: hypothetical protein AB7I79_00255 [Rhizobiaceae bacterium]
MDRPTRRDLLVAAPMLTYLLLAGRGARAQQFAGLDASYAEIGAKFPPRPSVGNVSGSAVDLPVFVHLAAQAPATLVASFDGAIGTMENARIVSASSDYLEFRHAGAGGRIEVATVEMAADVSNDHSIAGVLSVSIERDLRVGAELVSNGALSVSQFRRQMKVLRDQRELLIAEEKRTRGGGAIYLPIQSRVRRTGSAETERLEQEIALLRTELETVQRRVAELSHFIMTN